MADNPLVYRLSNALALAKTAVEADNNSDYTSACWRYKELVVMLEADLPNFPSEIRPALAERIAVYRARAVSLESVLQYPPPVRCIWHEQNKILYPLLARSQIGRSAFPVGLDLPVALLEPSCAETQPRSPFLKSPSIQQLPR